jgi:hypothetical protein
LNFAPATEKQQRLQSQIMTFLGHSRGLLFAHPADGSIRITQTLDSKSVELKTIELDDVLIRSDTDGKEFIQINLSSGKKILVTDALIGFKPIALKGLDVAKLPRVVTTPDIMSVFEAIQDALHGADVDPHEVSVLKMVFEAVLAGGESIGFDLSAERAWLSRIPTHFSRTSA